MAIKNTFNNSLNIDELLDNMQDLINNMDFSDVTPEKINSYLYNNKDDNGKNVNEVIDEDKEDVEE